ncbi:hypothetical protein GC093_04430 [Paenibacillus sp. LMG 31456]|uniref:Undecaprenyl/decaprenyl-phosphate alpha-N-acetylglucosaminyl 1-phosphate transferase n=1 Tax=Paenibacillus foliorum TaxID=2654974 RepID=A0A972K038_9BACL|nr:MraY family glycosyltransferase [Paenibacillus foliorum]NOU92483.1 hypothetical protein [Paenibacillus foliorum]
MQPIAFFLALTLCAILTPIARVIALKLHIVDFPNTSLKTHNNPTPYLGGAAIFTTIAVTMYSLILVFNINLNTQQHGLMLGAFVILIIGLIDDIRAVTPVTKLSVQLLATFVVWSQGIGFSLFDHWTLNLAITLVWVIGVTNAFNMIDIMDGLAAGVSGICSLFLALLLHFSGDPFNSALMLTLSGSCLGFLAFNFNPAKIYMGDTGSLLIGFLLACTFTQWSEEKHLGYYLIVPLIILGVPLFELIFVSILRLKDGKSPLRGSKDHFALRLIKMGFSVKQTVLLAYAGAIVLGSIAFLILTFRFFAYEILGLTLVLVCLVAHKLSQVRVS